MEVKDFSRSITNRDYSRSKKLKPGKWSRLLRKEISIDLRQSDKNPIIKEKDYRLFIDDKFYVIKPPSNILPVWLGAFSLFMLIGSIFLVEEEWNFKGILIRSIPLPILIICIVYYFTMPKKESILNRMKGTITFPGFWWADNHTMAFDSVDFILSSPTRNMNSHFLQIIRPDFIYSLDMSFSVRKCYEDLSFITWYLDKNRPLPTGTAFDPYRHRDFERRKAEGFPPPLYKSAIPTPEATPEQQKEREKYWKDYEHRPDPNNEDFAIPSI